VWPLRATWLSAIRGEDQCSFSLRLMPPTFLAHGKRLEFDGRIPLTILEPEDEQFGGDPPRDSLKVTEAFTTIPDESALHRANFRPSAKNLSLSQVLYQQLFILDFENRFVVNSLIRDQEVASSNLVTPIVVDHVERGTCVFARVGQRRSERSIKKRKSSVFYKPKRGCACSDSQRIASLVRIVEINETTTGSAE
jgi:hypothetical protein